MIARKIRKIGSQDIFPLNAVVNIGLFTKGILIKKHLLNPKIQEFYVGLDADITAKNTANIKKHLKKIGFTLITAKESEVPSVRMSDGREGSRQDFPTIHLRLKKVKETEFNSTYFLGEIIEFKNSVRTSKDYIKSVLIKEGWKILKEY